jgi:flagellar biosynthetic protein FliQ
VLFLALKTTFDDGFILGICSEALYLILLLSAPMLISALAVGLIISVLQATTQVQEQTLSFVPKILVTFLSVIICSTWIGGMLGAFAVKIFNLIPNLVVK